jgi:hypothetical protein
MNVEQIQSALFDLYDVRRKLSASVKRQPKDEDSDWTVGDCLDNAIEVLEQLEQETSCA